MDKKLNPFVYGTDPELNMIFDRMVDLKLRVDAQFAKAEKIAGFTGSAKFEKYGEFKVELPNYRALRDGGNWSVKSSLATIDKVVQPAIEKARADIVAEEAVNVPIAEHNDQIKKQVAEIMTRIGVLSSYTTYDYPTSRSRTKKSTSHSAGYLGDLTRACPVNPVTGVKYQVDRYVEEYKRWVKAEEEAEKKQAIDRDEEAVKRNILGNPKLVATLMQAGVNILEAVQTAVPGKKSAVVEYCIAQALSNVRSQTDPDQSLINALESMSNNV